MFERWGLNFTKKNIRQQNPSNKPIEWSIKIKVCLSVHLFLGISIHQRIKVLNTELTFIKPHQHFYIKEYTYPIKHI